MLGRFTEALGLSRYAMRVFDYGAPIGLRLALAYPERVTALGIQNAVALGDDLGRRYGRRVALWANRAANQARLRAGLTRCPTIAAATILTPFTTCAANGHPVTAAEVDVPGVPRRGGAFAPSHGARPAQPAARAA